MNNKLGFTEVIHRDDFLSKRHLRELLPGTAGAGRMARVMNAILVLGGDSLHGMPTTNGRSGRGRFEDMPALKTKQFSIRRISLGVG